MYKRRPKTGEERHLYIIFGKKKKEFLSDSKYLRHRGFSVSDKTDCGIVLMYLPLSEDFGTPKFKDCAKHPSINEKGFVIYYTDQCPFTNYWVNRVSEVAKENRIQLKTIHVTDKATAQNMPAPVTNYALFREGKFITHAIQSDTKFLSLAK